MKKKVQKTMAINQTLPHQINAPSFKDTPIDMQPPFVNSHGVTIGDSFYTSKESPLENWSTETDPAVMAGSEWVHPTNDIGWNTDANKELLEKQKLKQTAPFMHPTINVSNSSD
ncbi:DUF3905 domain-containing protein [Bacillus benzoevorans]|uniref:DUF3905 domain-containing protein n=1 Tax=Bacillus benzoevorans TaxID=1456 RepID=A0A7X0LT78_9BACI|nr:DUF3905 domain-containing protein [Bacillus benzoevorans]MBB6443636.1 hypothetical protein [Bacillus benzoevorans]